MPDFLKVLTLAVIQGVTEFLPVSSSGHLVLVKHLLGMESPGVTLEVGLHAGTLVSVLLYYRKRILQLLREMIKGEGGGRYYVLAIFVSSLPSVTAYILLREKIESLFNSPMVTSAMLCLTGIFLFSLIRQVQRILRIRRNQTLSVGRGLWIGMAQAFALLPGISRSGATIVIGRHLGLSPKIAAEFSLLMSVPILLAATLVKAIGMAGAELGDVTVMSLVVGSLVAACVGYISIVCLIKTLLSGKFWMFGFYCIVVGVVGIMVNGH